MTTTGPAIRSVCRILNQNSCGSGSICGHHNGGSLVMTNAHVAGTRIGRQVQVDVESLGIRKTATVIRAAYSNQVVADWALLFIENWQEIEPVKLSKNPPPAGESMYTKGFPKCDPHNGTDIAQHRVMSNGVMLWLPDAISGQSGSGVWSDDHHIARAVLTWSWRDGMRSYGAGQLTAEIYRQNRVQRVVGYSRPEGLVELVDEQEYNLEGVEMNGVTDDPEVNEGFFSAPIERGIQDFPIWAEDDSTPPPDDDRPDAWTKTMQIELLRRQHEFYENEMLRLQRTPDDAGTDPSALVVRPPAIEDTFGL